MLERAAPEVIAVEASDGALTYAELGARAWAGALELRGASRVAIALPPGLDFAVALHACLLSGAVAVPVDLREPEWRLAGASVVVDAPLNGGHRGGSTISRRDGAAARRSVGAPAAASPLAAASSPAASSPAVAAASSPAAASSLAAASSPAVAAASSPAAASSLAAASSPVAAASSPVAAASSHAAASPPAAASAPATPARSSSALSAPALVVHTSGTTGVPRAVELTRGNILANALGCAVALGHDRRERWLCPLPLSHVGGLMVLLRSAIYGTTAVLGPADRDDVTIASLVPTQLARLIDRPPPPSLRVVMLGGAPADPALLERARDAGWPVAPTYGLTQACSAVTVANVGDTETSGRPIPGVNVSIAPDGEIVVDGPTTAGVLRTGDLGRLDERGRLIVLGRKVDTIVSGGENVMPSEVEAALLQHPAVAEAGVFGRPDAEWGEAVTARVVLRAPAEPAELRAFAAQRLARFKVPKTIEPVDSLPRNPAGKLLRRELA